jgi:hypothetical protein
VPSYQLQKDHGHGSFVVPVDPNDKATWGDKEHRLAQVAETTVIHKDVVDVRDNQWWRTFSRGYITQWAEMNPQRCDAFFYAHRISDVKTMAPLMMKFRSVPGRKVYLVISGGQYCSCEDAVEIFGWAAAECKARRFKVFDLEVGSVHRSFSETPFIQEVSASLRGLMKMHSPTLLITVNDLPSAVVRALQLATAQSGSNTSFVQIPRASFPHALWIATVPPASLPCKSRSF